MSDTTLAESDVESYALEILQDLGYTYLPPSSLTRRSDEPFLTSRLEDSLHRLNPTHSPSSISQALTQICTLHLGDLLSDNQAFHSLLCDGVKITHQIEGESRGDILSLIDFDNPLNNDFVVTSQFTFTQSHHTKRPDIVIFVNGLPLIIIELKDPTDESATLQSAYRQISTYTSLIPALFTSNAFCIISDGCSAKVGTISADYSRFMTWKNPTLTSPSTELHTLLTSMLSPSTLLDILRFFIVFERSQDTQKGSFSLVKKLASYHQYYAVNKAIEQVRKASSEGGDHRGGVVWHTQGSGKSLSMVFFSAKAIFEFDNPTLLIITDRNDLDDQLFSTFASSSSLLRQTPRQAQSRDELSSLLSVAGGGVIFSTIQKFQPQEGNVYQTLSLRSNIIVIADEAHRTQYGFHAKIIEKQNQKGEIEQRLIYGFAKYLRDALPNATYLGFTGTPIEKSDRSTPEVFGDYIDIYNIAQAIEDGATVPIHYESRLVKINLSDEGRKLVQELDEELESLEDSAKLKAQNTRLEAILGTKDRIDKIASDILSHFQARQSVMKGKAMIVCLSRKIAVELYDAIVRIYPHWHSDELTQGKVKVVMTADSSDGEALARHHTTKIQRQILAQRVKDINDELELVIVRDMWLTGFDAPIMHTLYIDKPMKGHNLMQAIARVNRVYKDKQNGLIVDYIGITSDLKEAIDFYSNSGGGKIAQDKSEAIKIMKEKYEIVQNLLSGFPYRKYFSLGVGEKLLFLLEAQEYILGLDNGKKRFCDEVTKLSQAFAMVVPSKEVLEIKDDIALFQALKARLQKFERSEGKSLEEMQTLISQIVNEAIVSEEVVDIFDASGIKKPDISILSDEFLLEVKNMKHKNTALELLKKLLNDEIKSRSALNPIQSQSLMKMLEESIRKYQNKLLTSAEIIDELIAISKEIKASDKQAQDLHLDEYEYAFYTAVADNDSARELMEKDTLRELAVVLAQSVRENASIDWTIKESVRAKLRINVKKILRKYGYPPNMAELATDNVIKQAEIIAKEIQNS